MALAEPVWTFGDYLTKSRKTAGLSRQDMADRLGVSVQMVGHWELDRSPMRVPTLKQWALLTGKPVGWFFGESVNPADFPPSPALTLLDQPIGQGRLFYVLPDDPRADLRPV